MSAVSFKQIHSHNTLLKAAVEAINVPDESPLCKLFEGIRTDLNQLTCYQLPLEVSDEAGKELSEKTFAKLRNIADFLDPALPGYAILHKLMTTPPTKMEEKEVVAGFTEQQKETLSLVNQAMIECFTCRQNLPIFSEKAVKNPKRGIPILTRMGTLVGRLSPMVIDDETCAKTLKVYELILEHHATSYPEQLRPTTEPYFSHEFESVANVLPTTQDELNTLTQKHEENTKLKELTKKVLSGIDEIRSFYQGSVYNNHINFSDDAKTASLLLQVPLALTEGAKRCALYPLFHKVELWTIGAREKIDEYNKRQNEYGDKTVSTEKLDEFGALVAELGQLCEL